MIITLCILDRHRGLSRRFTNDDLRLTIEKQSGGGGDYWADGHPSLFIYQAFLRDPVPLCHEHTGGLEAIQPRLGVPFFAGELGGSVGRYADEHAVSPSSP